MNHLMKLLVIAALIFSVNAQAQKRYASLDNMNYLYNQLYETAMFDDIDEAISIAGMPVMLELEINNNGRLVEAKMLKGTNTSMDNRLLAVIKKFDKWNPSMLDGRAIDDKIKFNMYFDEYSELRMGRLPTKVSEATVSRLVRYMERNVLSAVDSTIERRSGRMKIALQVNNNGEVKGAELSEFYVRDCSRTIEELLVKMPIRFPRLNTSVERTRYFTFQFYVDYKSGKCDVQQYTESKPVGGYRVFKKYINSQVDSVLLEQYSKLEAQFEVSIYGVLQKVKITQGQGALANQYRKALENAPKWIPAGVDSMSVVSEQLLGFRNIEYGKLMVDKPKRVEFEGGDIGLTKFTKEHMDIYRTDIQNTMKLNERVRVEWVIDVDGNLRSYNVLSGRNRFIMQAIENMAENMPRWNTLTVNGLLTTASYTQNIDLSSYRKR